MKTITRIAGLALSLCALSAQALAHEFWISPERGRYAPGETITGDLMVGIALVGEPYPYLPNRFNSFTVTANGQTRAIDGLPGDLPALKLSDTDAGLHILGHHTVAFRATYEDWAVFQRYLREEGFPELEAVHLERGLPKQGFAERYTRCAKVLVQVGPPDATDIDTELGLPLELVAGANPYLPGTTEVPVRLTWQGAPVAGRQITVFHKADETTRTILTTDADGRAVLPLSGAGEYLLNAVDLVPYDGDPVVWESHWATLGFKL